MACLEVTAFGAATWSPDRVVPACTRSAAALPDERHPNTGHPTSPAPDGRLPCATPGTDHAGMLPARARSRAVAALLALLALGLLLSGCTVSTPICDQAATLLPQGRPLDAMALYARAEDEGNCASNGLAAAGALIAEAASEEAKGAAAEQVGDTTGAIDAYRTALARNAGDARAAAGLVRLGQPTGTPAPADIPPLSRPAEPTGWWRSEWPLLV